MRPRQVELSESERTAMKESHKFALALTKPRKQHQTQAPQLAKCIFAFLTAVAFNPPAAESKPRSKEMQELLDSIGESKLLHTNVQMKSSSRAKEVFDKMKSTRRTLHTEALNEYEAWTETFVEGMNERFEERKKKAETVKKNTGSEIEQLLVGMTDQALLAGKVEDVIYVWDRVTEMKKQRKEELNELGTTLRELAKIKRKSMTEYVANLKAKLIDIAFVLEPEAVNIIQEMLVKHQEELDKEDKEIEDYLKEQADENQKVFEDYYVRWKQKKEQFHTLKQNEAIQNFQTKLNESYYVNPQERVDVLKELMDYQLQVYNDRKQIIATLRQIPIADITKNRVNELDEQLKQLSEVSSEKYKEYFQNYIKVQDARYGEAVKLAEAFRDFLTKNDANLPEGKTFDMLIQEECTPLIDQRLSESKSLFLHVDKYLDEYDTRMHEYAKNIVAFYRFVGESYDVNRKDFKNAEMNFELAIAKLADKNEEDMNVRDSGLKEAVELLRKSVTHVALVKQLEVCYGKLDEANKEYDHFAANLKTLIDTQEPRVVTLFTEFEKKLAKHFEMDTEESRERIQERLTRETEEKQKQLEAEYIKKQEEEELKALEQNPTAAKGKAPAKKAPAKGKKEPVLDVPQLEVPKIEEYKSPSGETYLIEYGLDTIAEGLMRTEEEIEQQRIEEERLEEERKRLEIEAAEEAKTKGKGKKVETKKEEVKLTEEEEKLRQEEEEKQAKIKADHEEKERLKSNVPVDPNNNQCLHEKLILTKEEVLEILGDLLGQMMEEIHARRTKYIEELHESNGEVIEKNMKDVDKLFQKSWPDKETVEVDVFQTRQAEIANHKKIYDKHIRSVLEKNEEDEKAFGETVEEFSLLVSNYEKLLAKYIAALDDFSNLSELQGYLRKTKEAYNILTEQVNKFKVDLNEYAGGVDSLLKFNRNFVNSCTLQQDGGTYSEEEKNHYDALIKCIDDKFVDAKSTRQKTIAELLQDAEQRKSNPYNDFEAKYAEANSSLAAKEGLGKSFGKPKRILQDQLKAEMSKCDEAQRGVDSLIDKLKNMLEEYQSSSGSSLLSRRPASLSLEIRRTVVTLRNCIVKYAEYLNGFKEGFVPEELQRITSDEMKEDVALTEEEVKRDAEAKAEEIRCLGMIGYQAGTDKDITFMAALNKIEENVKNVARNLYQGANGQLLQGDDKIPEYLENYLRTTHAQTNEFRIGCIRALRNTVHSA